jgi:RNA polymerase primary sigma factor
MTPTQVTDEMISAAQDGDNDAMWSVISGSDSALRGIVRSAAPGARGEDAEDLLQEARAALVQRVRDYDSSASSAALMTFAYRAIRRTVAEEWVRMSTGLTVDAGTAIRVKRSLVDFDGNREAAYLSMHAKYGTSREVFMGTLEALADVESLEGPSGVYSHKGVKTDSETTLADTIPDTSSEFTDTHERRDLARWLMTQISPRQSYALRAFFGVGMLKAEDDEVAAHLQTQRTAVRRLRSTGVQNARNVASRHAIAA